jgi:hypothetical protein
LLLEFWRSVGLDIFAALAKVEEQVGLAPSLEPAGSETAALSPPAAPDNEAAMAQLGALMSKVGGLVK